MSSKHTDEPISSDILEALKRASTATITTQLFKHGFRQQFLVGVGPLNPKAARFAGEAFTMRFIPAREDRETLESVRQTGEANLQWEGVEQLSTGQVLVVDSRRDIRAASMGSILAKRLERRGAAAIVTDGAFRDGPAIATMDIPSYAAAMTASTRLSFHHVADLQTPIGCADVAVYPGDIVVGDPEGVVVIPRHLAAVIAEDAPEQEELEEYLFTRIDAGEPLWGVYPPGDDVMAEFREHQRRELASDRATHRRK